MSGLSDEAAARSAERAGGRLRTSRPPKILCMEPASFRFDEKPPAVWLPAARVYRFGIRGRIVANPGIYSQHRCDPMNDPRTWGGFDCPNCGSPMFWTGPPERGDYRWIYRVECIVTRCQGQHEDEIEAPFRLLIGGTVEWWSGLGWDLS